MEGTLYFETFDDLRRYVDESSGSEGWQPQEDQPWKRFPELTGHEDVTVEIARQLSYEAGVDGYGWGDDWAPWFEKQFPSESYFDRILGWLENTRDSITDEED